MRINLINLCVLCWLAYPSYAGITAISAADHKALTASRDALVRNLEENIIPFWYPQVIDSQNGGFRLNHDIEGTFLGEADKALVTQTRTVWFFSRLYRSPFGKPEHLQAARHGYRFLIDAMKDPEHGGYYWEVSPSGQEATKSDKHLYGQSFALYALSEYALATGDSAAKAQAMELFSLLEFKAHDKRHGGYFETFHRDWTIPEDSYAGYMGVTPGMKLMNTHLHLLESFTTLYQLTRDPVVRERLLELVLIESNTVVRKGIAASTDKFRLDWTPVLTDNYDRVSYGHDIENIWLLREACDAASVRTQPLMDLFEQVFAYALQYGYDHEGGGFYDTGDFHALADQRRKVWWVQAEGLVSALTLYQLTGKKHYLETYHHVLEFVNQNQTDWENGDWFSTVDEDGSTGGMKASAWKSPYHNGRAMLECIRITDELLKLPVE